MAIRYDKDQAHFRSDLDQPMRALLAAPGRRPPRAKRDLVKQGASQESKCHRPMAATYGSDLWQRRDPAILTPPGTWPHTPPPPPSTWRRRPPTPPQNLPRALSPLRPSLPWLLPPRFAHPPLHLPRHQDPPGAKHSPPPYPPPTPPASPRPPRAHELEAGRQSAGPACD